MVENACVVDDEKWMSRAIDLAAEAMERGEFPVGCVLVSGGVVVGEGMRRNSRADGLNELDHAEILALRELVKNGRSSSACVDLTVYSTLEPCLMCLGALILNGVKRIVFAYEDVMGGACGLDFSHHFSALPHSPAIDKHIFYNGYLYKKGVVEIVGGVKRSESLSLFKSFFADPPNSYWRASLLAGYTMAV